MGWKYGKGAEVPPIETLELSHDQIDMLKKSWDIIKQKIADDLTLISNEQTLTQPFFKLFTTYPQVNELEYATNVPQICRKHAANLLQIRFTSQYVIE